MLYMRLRLSHSNPPLFLYFKITDLPAHSVAVGVPARIIGSFVDVTEQPSLSMNQLMDDSITTVFESDGI
jgi:serine O-acetyltransferase